MNTFVRTFLIVPFCFPMIAWTQQAGVPAAGAVPAVSAGRVQLDVVVTNKTGKAVPDLGPQDFTLLDNNQPVKIASFHASDGADGKADRPVEVILLIDTVNVEFKNVSYIRQEIERYLEQGEGHLAQPVSIFIFTEKGLDLQRAPILDGNKLATNVKELDNVVRLAGASGGVNGLIDRFYKSVQALTSIAGMEAKKPGRKLLIWAGPGWPMLDSVGVNVTREEQGRNFKKIVALSTLLREARMTVYSVSTEDVGVDATAYLDFLKGVRSAEKSTPGDLAFGVIALHSGGRVLGPDNHLTAQIESCIEDSKSSYRLTFDPARAAHADEYHDLKVVVDKPGLTVRTDTGYYNQP